MPLICGAAPLPLPPPKRMGTLKYIDIWLVDKSGRFKVDALTEGQP